MKARSFFAKNFTYALLFIFSSLTSHKAEAKLVVYPAPSGAIENKDYSVQVREENGTWQDLFEYSETVNLRNPQQASFAYFDASYSPRIEIKVTKNSGTISKVRIRPLSYNINSIQSGNSISFFIDKPRKLSIEFNNDIYHNLHLFANALEVNPSKESDSGVVYFGPGIHRPTSCINIAKNQTIYIAGGAIVKGCIRAKGVSNITIKGRGILDASVQTGNAIFFDNCSNIVLDGIIITNAQTWCVVPQLSNDILITDIKEISHKLYSDGIDPVSCQNVVIDNVFIRNGDDCISIKATGTEPNQNITIKNSVFWSDIAHGILIGPEGNGLVTEKVLFTNNDVLEINMPDPEWWGAMAITNGDKQKIRDITFENVRVEDFTAGNVVCIRIESNRYVQTAGDYVKNIRFKNISYNGSSQNPNRIFGYNSSQCVDSVSFENFTINNKMVLSPLDGKFDINQYVYHVTFKGQSTPNVNGNPAALAKRQSRINYILTKDNGMIVKSRSDFYSLQGKHLDCKVSSKSLFTKVN